MNWVIGIALDLILVAIIVICIKKGSDDGFAKTLISFLGVFIALVVAGVLCKPAANFTYNTFIKKPVATTVENAIRGQIDDISQSAPSINDILDGIEENIDTAPSFIKNAFNIEEKRQELANSINKIYTSDITELSQRAADTIVKPIVITSVAAIVFVALFVIISIIIAIISKTLKLVNKIPLLGGVNKLLGGVIGALKGILIVLILNWALSTLTSGGADLCGIITADTIQCSLIMKNLAKINPLNLVISQIAVLK